MGQTASRSPSPGPTISPHALTPPHRVVTFLPSVAPEENNRASSRPTGPRAPAVKQRRGCRREDTEREFMKFS